MLLFFRSVFKDVSFRYSNFVIVNLVSVYFFYIYFFICNFFKVEVLCWKCKDIFFNMRLKIRYYRFLWWFRDFNIFNFFFGKRLIFCLFYFWNILGFIYFLDFNIGSLFWVKCIKEEYWSNFDILFFKCTYVVIFFRI